MLDRVIPNQNFIDTSIISSVYIPKFQTIESVPSMIKDPKQCIFYDSRSVNSPKVKPKINQALMYQSCRLSQQVPIVIT